MQFIAKIGESVDITYQATKQTSGLTDVTMVIYDETRALDGVNFPDVTMTEIGSTGIYYGSFTPDAVGVWTVIANSPTKQGQVVQTVIVTNNDIDSIADAIAALNNLSSADITSVLTSYGVATVDDVTGQPMLG
jgi:hypothetical protein